MNIMIRSYLFNIFNCFVNIKYVKNCFIKSVNTFVNIFLTRNNNRKFPRILDILNFNAFEI